MFSESYVKLVQFLEDVKKGYPVDSSKIFLFGFSMGTMMAYSVALTHPEWITGVVANSGYIPEDAGLQLRWKEIDKKPFFVAHGKFDPVIPVPFGKRAKELLENAGASVVYREYEMGHEISNRSLLDLSAWLEEKVLSSVITAG